MFHQMQNNLSQTIRCRSLLRQSRPSFKHLEYRCQKRILQNIVRVKTTIKTLGKGALHNLDYRLCAALTDLGVGVFEQGFFEEVPDFGVSFLSSFAGLELVAVYFGQVSE